MVAVKLCRRDTKLVKNCKIRKTYIADSELIKRSRAKMFRLMLRGHSPRIPGLNGKNKILKIFIAAQKILVRRFDKVKL